MATDLTHESSLDDQPLNGAVVPEPARLRLRLPLGTIAAFLMLAVVDIDVGRLIGLLVETLPFDRRLSDEWLLQLIHTSRLFCLGLRVSWPTGEAAGGDLDDAARADRSALLALKPCVERSGMARAMSRVGMPGSWALA